MITEQDDTNLLQNDLTMLCNWSKNWKLKLNADKCKSFSITLGRDPIVHSYRIGETYLESVETIRVGVILDTKLTFSKHIDTSVS